METAQGKKHKILVVDDNSENIRIIGSILRQTNYNVGFATGGQQALDILEVNSKDYDLVLLDVNMPGMNGFEVCAKIRENGLLKELPVIFLTANTLPEQIVEGFTSGGQDYVTKPFHAGELLARISTHLELKDSREQLKRINEILEEKVRERTKELQQANLKLEAANRELEELDQSKADFLRMISHEINTPLNGILGFADVLTEQLVDTEYFSFVEYLNHSAHRLNDFTQASLLITELRTTPHQYPKTTINIIKTLDDTLCNANNTIESKNITMNKNYLVEECQVEANEQLLKACLVRILNNAIQHTPKDSEIKLSLQKAESEVVLSIEDQGPGFSDAALRNLFKPFSTGIEHSDSRMGLSLHLVKMIVDHHQAQISATNTSTGAKVEIKFSMI